MTKQTRNTEGLTFYSEKAIGIATFIGGPMAAGYLIRENYRSLGEVENGKNALIISIVFTIALFVGVFSIPESMMDKVPNQILPAVYTGIIYLIVTKIQGERLQQHRKNGHEFHSGWKAAGIGAISLGILLIGLFGYAYLSTDDELYDKYDKELALFTQNETEALQFFDSINTKSEIELIQEIDSSIIPKWQENIEIIKQTNRYENMPHELAEQNVLLKEYAELRLEEIFLFRKIIQQETDIYDLST